MQLDENCINRESALGKFMVLYVGKMLVRHCMNCDAHVNRCPIYGCGYYPILSMLCLCVCYEPIPQFHIIALLADHSVSRDLVGYHAKKVSKTNHWQVAHKCNTWLHFLSGAQNNVRIEFCCIGLKSWKMETN